MLLINNNKVIFLWPCGSPALFRTRHGRLPARAAAGAVPCRRPPHRGRACRWACRPALRRALLTAIGNRAAFLGLAFTRTLGAEPARLSGGDVAALDQVLLDARQRCCCALVPPRERYLLPGVRPPMAAASFGCNEPSMPWTGGDVRAATGSPTVLERRRPPGCP